MWLHWLIDNALLVIAMTIMGVLWHILFWRWYMPFIGMGLVLMAATVGRLLAVAVL